MIEFHTRFNNAAAIEAPRGLRSRIQHRGRGWLYEIGNSFNVDFELVEEGVVIARGPAPGIEDAKKAFMSHFADVKRKVQFLNGINVEPIVDHTQSMKPSDHTRFGINCFERTRNMCTVPFGQN
jgi:hypothetical protein